MEIQSTSGRFVQTAMDPAVAEAVTVGGMGNVVEAMKARKRLLVPILKTKSSIIYLDRLGTNTRNS